MPIELENAHSHRLSNLAKKLRHKKYRSTYLASHIKIFLANQISALRGSLSQGEFGNLLGKPQSVVSRLQNPNYGKYTLQTLLDIAAKMDMALIVRFVDYPTFLTMTDNFSDRAVRPDSFSPEQVDNLVAKEMEKAQIVELPADIMNFKQEPTERRGAQLEWRAKPLGKPNLGESPRSLGQNLHNLEALNRGNQNAALAYR